MMANDDWEVRHTWFLVMLSASTKSVLKNDAPNLLGDCYLKINTIISVN
jgi:hypothetical protein